MRRMQVVAPQIKELQAKYKGNRTKLNEELMKFYKENEINPFASCLPLVAQLPIFIALYYVLKHFAKDATVQGGSLSFMWAVPDVTRAAHRHRLGRVRDRGDLRACPSSCRPSSRPTPNMPDVAAADHAGAAAGGGAVRLPVPGPGGPGHLLDDDQPLDRAASSW